jgi:hypothetical protein
MGVGAVRSLSLVGLPIIGIIFGLSVAVVVVLKTLAPLAGALVGAFVFG